MPRRTLRRTIRPSPAASAIGRRSTGSSRRWPISKIGHSALRMYIMGKRALSEKATDDDMTGMARAVQEALKAGALGFSSSHASTHVTPDDTPVASCIGDWQEIDRILAAMAELDDGIFQVGPDIASGARHRVFLERLRQVALKHKRPIMFGVLATRQGDDPTSWAYQ